MRLIILLQGVKNGVLWDIRWVSMPYCFEPNWPNDREIKKAERLKILMAHGIADSLVDIQLAHKSEETYRGFGYDVTFIEIDGAQNVTRNEMNQMNDWITHIKK